MTTTLTPSTQQPASLSPEQRLKATLDRIFAELHGHFGNQFLDKFRTGQIANGLDTGIENARTVWGQKIVEARLKPSEIQRGLATCGRNRFAPNCGEFLDACRPPLNIDAAVQEAIQQLHARNQGKDVWSDPVIFWAAQEVGYFEMTTMTVGALKPRFEAAIMRVRKAGGIKPVPRMNVVPALAHSTVTAEQAAANRAHLAQLAERVKGNGGPVDGLRWAHRLMAKERAGQRISLTQLEFAREALRLGAEPA